MGTVHGDGPLVPRHPDLREDPQAPEHFAHRRDELRRPEPAPEPKHPPGAPERLEREAVRLERRAAWVMLLAPPFAILGGNVFTIVGLLLGLLANLTAIVAAAANRPTRARDAAGVAVVAYATSSFATIFSMPVGLLAFIPLGIATTWLGRARQRRHEAWRIVWSARNRANRDAARRRDAR